MMCPEPERRSSHCSTNPSSEEQDRMGREETVHIRINRRRRRIQMWHQWFGLGSVSPFRSRNRIEDQIRIRLQDGYMEQEYGNIFYRKRIPRIPVHVTPSNRKHCSEIFKLNWPSNNPKIFPHFAWDLRDSICDGTATRLFFRFLFFKCKEEQGWAQNQEEGWEVQDGSIRVRRVVNSWQTLKRTSRIFKPGLHVFVFQ